MANQTFKIALLGNPNTGKSSVFNQLTGLRQKVGNFPGVTVERKNGAFKLDNNTDILVTDFPGTYSLFPTSLDERIVLNALTNKNDIDYPDAVGIPDFSAWSTGSYFMQIQSESENYYSKLLKL